MRLAARLRRLDDAWLRNSARRLRHFSARTLGHGPAGAATGTVHDTLVAQPALAGSIAVVLAAGILFATAGRGPDADTTTAPVAPVIPSFPATPLATIGPAPGTSVSVYLARAKQDLEHYGQIAAQRPTYAVVDFRRYLTPTEAVHVAGASAVSSGYVRVPSALPTQSRKVPIASSAELVKGITSVGLVAAATTKTYTTLLASLHPHSNRDRQLALQYRMQRRTAALEARELSHPAKCHCVFAMVVHGDVAALNTLARNPLVRVVDPAPPVVPLNGLTVLPLQPQIRSTVPRDGLPGG